MGLKCHCRTLKTTLTPPTKVLGTGGIAARLCDVDSDDDDDDDDDDSNHNDDNNKYGFLEVQALLAVFVM